jgi:hypothetical protein
VHNVEVKVHIGALQVHLTRNIDQGLTQLNRYAVRRQCVATLARAQDTTLALAATPSTYTHTSCPIAPASTQNTPKCVYTHPHPPARTPRL